MRYLLDTDICIYIIKNQPLSVLRKFRQCLLGDVGISVITLAELHYGVEKSQHKQKNCSALANFILPLKVIPFDEQASASYGTLRAALEAMGQPIGSLDLMIAAHAKSLQLTLITNNTKEFSRIPDLKIENWVEEN